MDLYKQKGPSTQFNFFTSEIFIYAAIDFQNQVIISNDQFRKIYQHDYNASSTVRFSELFVKEDQQRIEQELKGFVLNPRNSFHYVFTSRLNDGQLFSVHWEFKVHLDWSTKKPFIAAFGYPLSSNRAVKFALLGVVQHFEIIFDKNPDILVVMDRSFNIFKLNTAAKDFFAKGNVEVPAKGINLMALKNRYNIDLMILLHSFNEGNHANSHSEVLQIDQDYYAVNIAISDQYFSFLMKDITESKQTIRKLRDAQLNLKQLLDNSLDAVVYFNPTLAITYFNNEAAKNFQTSDGDIMSEGADIRTFFPKELKVEISEFEEIVKKGKWISKDMLVSNRWLRVNLYPIKDQEYGNFNFAFTASDITNIKEMQRQLESQNESLKKINWRHSHELRAPLSNILGLIQLIENASNIQQTDFDLILNGLKKSSEQLDQVIHEIVAESYNSLS